MVILKENLAKDVAMLVPMGEAVGPVERVEMQE